MKRLITTVLLCTMVTGLYAGDLTNEEKRTVYQLKNTGIFTKERTTEEWRQPMRTVDVASAVMKNQSHIFEISDYIQSMNIASFDFMQNQINSQHLKVDEVERKQETLQANQDGQVLFNWLIVIGLIGSFIL